MTEILQGHVMDVLPTMDAESAQMICTSPPYWGLRDYGLEPQIWDAQEGCRHEWGGGTGNTKRHSKLWATNSNPENRYDEQVPVPQGQFCTLCGAWRGSLGLEPTPELFVKHIVDIFREVRRVLRKDGVVWLNLGDSYSGSGARGSNPGGKGGLSDTNKGSWFGSIGESIAPGLKPKDLIGIPWRCALALQQDGWWLRSDIIWHKPNPMPESVTDRPTRSHEYVFLLSKAAKYAYYADAVREECKYDNSWSASDTHTAIGQGGKHGKTSIFKKRWEKKEGIGRNARTVWTIPTQPYKEAHFATFPEKLVEKCILAGSKIGDTVLDPFGGSGTVGKVATRLSRNATLVELNPEYVKMAEKRNAQNGFEWGDQ